MRHWAESVVVISDAVKILPMHVLSLHYQPDFTFVKFSPFSLNLVMKTTAENIFITAEKGRVARAKGEGERENECTTEDKSRRRRDKKALWALNYGSGEGGGDEKGRRRGGEKRAMYV